MLSVEKQIEYWKSGAESNMETAEILIKNNKYVEGLFFCHLSIEKMLKALIVKETKEIPPKSHNLKYLQELANIQVSNEHNSFMAILMKYQLEGRYPEYYPNIPHFNTVTNYLNKSKKLLLCLKKIL